MHQKYCLLRSCSNYHIFLDPWVSEVDSSATLLEEHVSGNHNVIFSYASGLHAAISDPVSLDDDAGLSSKILGQYLNRRGVSNSLPASRTRVELGSCSDHQRTYEYVTERVHIFCSKSNLVGNNCSLSPIHQLSFSARLRYHSTTTSTIT